MSTKPKRGRPVSERGTPPIRTIRLHDDEWAIIKSAAESSGRTVSEVARELLLRWARRTAKVSQ